MTRAQAMLRWLAAVGSLLVLVLVLYAIFGNRFGSRTPSIGTTERRVDSIIDLGDDSATDCSHPELQRGSFVPAVPLRPRSTACVVVGAVDGSHRLRWFFIGRGAGDGTVRAPRPDLVGLRDVRLVNGAVVPIGSTVAVRCSPDPNARFETWVADGKATAAYLDASGTLVGVGCDPA